MQENNATDNCQCQTTKEPLPKDSGEPTLKDSGDLKCKMEKEDLGPNMMCKPTWQALNEAKANEVKTVNISESNIDLAFNNLDSILASEMVAFAKEVTSKGVKCASDKYIPVARANIKEAKYFVVKEIKKDRDSYAESLNYVAKSKNEAIAKLEKELEEHKQFFIQAMVSLKKAYDSDTYVITAQYRKVVDLKDKFTKLDIVSSYDAIVEEHFIKMIDNLNELADKALVRNWAGVSDDQNKEFSKLIPFNVSKALEGEDVITRSGVPVTKVVRIGSHSSRSLLVEIGDCLGTGSIFVTDESGLYAGPDSHEPHSRDLFMAPKKTKKVTIQIYKHADLKSDKLYVDFKKEDESPKRLVKEIDVEIEL